MAVEEGIVTKIEENFAFVKVVRSAGCAHCPSASSCHIESDRIMIVRAQNKVRAKVGQRVKLYIAPGSIIAASFLLYVVPLFGLLLGAIVGKIFIAPLFPEISSELLAAGMGLLSMAGVFLGIKFYDKQSKKADEFIPKIIKIV